MESFIPFSRLLNVQAHPAAGCAQHLFNQVSDFNFDLCAKLYAWRYLVSNTDHRVVDQLPTIPFLGGNPGEAAVGFLRNTHLEARQFPLYSTKGLFSNTPQPGKNCPFCDLRGYP
jgi:hypothetical protein